MGMLSILHLLFVFSVVTQVNLCSPANNETYQERLLRLEGDKESLVLQVRSVCVCVFAHPHLISFRSIVRWPFIVMVTKNLWSPLVSLDLVSETGSCLEGSGGHTAEPAQCLVCNPSAWDISRDFITKHARAPSNRLSMCLLTTLTAAINIRASAVREKIIYLYIIWWQPARSALRSLQ